MLTPRSGGSGLLILIGWILSLLLGLNLSAQPPQTPPVSASPQAAPPADSPPESLWKLFVPFKALKDLSIPSGTVFLSNQQFEELWKLARRSLTPIADTAQLTSAEYVATADDRLLILRGTLTFHTAAKSWSRCELDFGSGKLSSIRWVDPGPVVWKNAQGKTELLLPSAGLYKGEFEVAYSLSAQNGEVLASLQIPPAPVGSLQLTINRPGLVVASPQKLPIESIPTTDNTTVKIPLGGEAQARLIWPAQALSVAPDQLLFTSEQTLLFRFSPGKTYLEARFEHHKLRGSWNKLQVALPVTARIIDVRSPEVARWEAVTEPERQLLNLEIAPGASPRLTTTLLLELPLQEGALDLVGKIEPAPSGIVTLGTVRETGWMGVVSSEDLDVAVSQRQGLVAASAPEVPEHLRQSHADYFRFYSPDYSLRLSVAEIQPRIRVQSLTQVRVSDQDWHLSARFRMNVDRSGLYTATFNLPENLTVTKVETPSLREFSISEDKRRLTVRLSEKALGDLEIVVEGRQPAPPLGQVANLPSVEPQNAIHEEGRVEVLAPEALEVITDPAGVKGATSGDVQPVQGSVRIVSSWLFNSRPVQIPVTTTRKPPRLTAEVESSVNLRPKSAEIRSLIGFDVSYSGVSQFVISLPDIPDVTPRIETQGDRNLLKQAVSSEPVEGWRIWTLTTQREILGNVTFEVTYDLPLPDLKDSQVSLDFLLPRLLVPATEGQVIPIASRGEVALRAEDIWSLAAAPEGLDEIDVRELETPVEGAVLAYRYFETPLPQTPLALKIAAQKLDRKDVVRTIVSRGLVEIVMTFDDMAYYRCRYRVTTSERQRLGIQLPREVDPLHLDVGGKTTLLEQAGQENQKSNLYYINVDRETPTDQEFGIQLIFRTRILPFAKGRPGGMLNPSLPRLGVTSESEEPAVQEQRLVIWTPAEISLVGTPADFHKMPLHPRHPGDHSEQDRRDEWEGWIRVAPSTGAEFPLVGRPAFYQALGDVSSLKVQWWRWNWIVMLLFAVLALIGWIVRHTTWANRITLLLLLAFTTCLLGAGDWDFVRHLFLAARFGLLAIVLVWGLTEVLGWLNPPKKSSSQNPGGLLFPWGQVLAPVIPPPGTFSKSSTDSTDRPAN